MRLLLVARRAPVLADQNEVARYQGALARREALRQLAPRGDDLLAAAAALRLALAAAVGVVDGVHGHAADDGPAAEPALAAGLAEGAVHLVAVADDADRRAAPGVDEPDLAGGHLELGVALLDGHKLDAGARGAAHLRPPARDHLHAVE